MDYYKLRVVVMQRIKDHLEQRLELTAQGKNPPLFADFQRRLMLHYGVPRKMIRQMVEQLAPGATVNDKDELIRGDI